MEPLLVEGVEVDARRWTKIPRLTRVAKGEGQAVLGAGMKSRKVDVRLPGKGNSKLPWRKAGPPNHLDDKVDSDQQVVNKELSLWTQGAGRRFQG